MPKGYCKDCDCAAERADQGEGVFDCHFFPPAPTGQFSRVRADDFCVQFRPRAETVKAAPPRKEEKPEPAQRIARETRPAAADAARAKKGKTKR